MDVGNLVGAGENTLLTTIIQYDPMYANVDMNERDLVALMELNVDRRLDEEYRMERVRQIPLELGLPSDDGYPIAGTVHYTAQGVDPETGTLLIQGSFPNPAPHKLLPGLFVRVRTPFEELEDQLLVPEVALGSGQGGKYLLVVDEENVVQHHPVTLGSRLGTMRVIASGLEPDDWVIVNGLLRARPGAKVTPERTDLSVQPAADTEAGTGG